MIRTALFTLGLSLAASSASAQAAPQFLVPPSLSTPPGSKGPHGYSQVVVIPANAQLIYISGQVALDSAGTIVGAGDFKAQATKVFENLQTALAAAGASFKDVVKLNFYLTDVHNLPALREVRDQFINPSAPPASTLVEVRALFRPEVMLEVEAVAAK
jgi:enamine deaminase RidA (YjgF/YER057c/UK114 family)